MSESTNEGAGPNAYPGPYKARFPSGCVVQVADEDALRHFKSTWKYHHPLGESQLQFAGLITAVCGIGYYHGGDVLYTLRDTGGTDCGADELSAS